MFEPPDASPDIEEEDFCGLVASPPDWQPASSRMKKRTRTMWAMFVEGIGAPYMFVPPG
ncbi:MAG TPA: hypothetical protein VK738_07485 [Terriglobales bacterium]|nr:hypothetical protein [Terriglobales bacterium]